MYLEKKQLEQSIVGTVILTSFTELFFRQFDPFKLEEGYSVLWLLVLYIIGAYIKKYNPLAKTSSFKIFLAVIFLVFLTSGISFINAYVSKKFFGEVKGFNFLIGYTSPTIVAISIGLLICFSRLSLVKIKPLVALFAPSAFSVYLIHVHPVVRKEVLNNRFSDFASFSSLKMTIMILIVGVGVFLISSIIDILRRNVTKSIMMLKYNYLETN